MELTLPDGRSTPFDRNRRTRCERAIHVARTTGGLTVKRATRRGPARQAAIAARVRPAVTPSAGPRIMALDHTSRPNAPDRLHIRFGGRFPAVAGPLVAIGAGEHGMDPAALEGGDVYERITSAVDFTTHNSR